MRHSLHTEIEIDASPEAVWSVLTDLDRYPEWNPFITAASGVVAVGERLKNHIEPPSGRASSTVDTASSCTRSPRAGLVSCTPSSSVAYSSARSCAPSPNPRRPVSRR